MFRAGGAGMTWEVTQEVTSREKLESVNKMGREGVGEGWRQKAGGSKEEYSGSTRVVCEEGSGQERLSLEDKGWSDSRGTWNATLGSPGLRWAPPEVCEGGRPRPSSESEDIRGGGTTEEARHEAKDQAGTHCRRSGERCPGCERRSKSSKGEQVASSKGEQGCGAAQKVKPVGLRPDVGQ